MRFVQFRYKKGLRGALGGVGGEGREVVDLVELGVSSLVDFLRGGEELRGKVQG